MKSTVTNTKSVKIDVTVAAEAWVKSVADEKQACAELDAQIAKLTEARAALAEPFEAVRAEIAEEVFPLVIASKDSLTTDWGTFVYAEIVDEKALALAHPAEVEAFKSLESKFKKARKPSFRPAKNATGNGK